MDRLLLIDFLNVDNRPTFAIDLDGKELEKGHASYYNPALLRRKDLKEAIHSEKDEGVCFRRWAGAQDAMASTYTYRSMTWTACTIRNTWRFVSLVQPVDLPLSDNNEGANYQESSLTRHNHWLLLADTRDVDPDLHQHLEYIRNVNWENTSLGPISSWPCELHHSVNLIMLDMRPTALFLGEENYFIYNHSYSVIAGHRHPSVIGALAKNAWPEAWSIMKSHMDGTHQPRTVAERVDAVQFFLLRNGFLEEAYVKFLIIPLKGPVLCFFNPVQEVTQAK